jgi:peptide-methionine (S)-S-oxide reductase
MNALDIDADEELITSHVAARLNGYIGGYGKMSDFDQEWKALGITERMAMFVKC